MRGLTILVDADDTIEYLAEAWIAILNERYGRSVCVDDLTSWEIQKAFPGLTKDEVYAPLKDESIWDRVRPREDAVYYLRRLIERGHKVYIVTATNHETYKAKMEKVLLRYFPYIHRTKVIVAYNKKMIQGDVRVDDGVHNLKDCDGLRILMSAPHNRTFDAEAHGIKRVSNWQEIYALILDYSGETMEGDEKNAGNALFDRVSQVLDFKEKARDKGNRIHRE